MANSSVDSYLMTSSPYCNTLDDDPEPWEVGNGSAIWISPSSKGNLVARNSILDVDGDSVVVEGDGNRIEVLTEDESVSDLGRANTVESCSGQ